MDNLLFFYLPNLRREVTFGLKHLCQEKANEKRMRLLNVIWILKQMPMSHLLWPQNIFDRELECRTCLCISRGVERNWVMPFCFIECNLARFPSR